MKMNSIVPSKRWASIVGSGLTDVRSSSSTGVSTLTST